MLIDSLTNQVRSSAWLGELPVYYTGSNRQVFGLLRMPHTPGLLMGRQPPRFAPCLIGSPRLGSSSQEWKRTFFLGITCTWRKHIEWPFVSRRAALTPRSTSCSFENFHKHLQGSSM